MLLGCRLMVGQEILVLFIMVRIRAPQPNKNAHKGLFYLYLYSTSVIILHMTDTANKFQNAARDIENEIINQMKNIRD